jgi:hypothetical protein
MSAVSNTVVFCSSSISCFRGTLLTYCASGFEMGTVAPLITVVILLSNYYYYYLDIKRCCVCSHHYEDCRIGGWCSQISPDSGLKVIRSISFSGLCVWSQVVLPALWQLLFFR